MRLIDTYNLKNITEDGDPVLVDIPATNHKRSMIIPTDLTKFKCNYRLFFDKSIDTFNVGLWGDEKIDETKMKEAVEILENTPDDRIIMGSDFHMRNEEELQDLLDNIKSKPNIEESILLLLGDVTYGWNNMNVLQRIVKEIKPKKIFLTLGNHDYKSMLFYDKLVDFVAITIETSKYLFSHCPIPVPAGKINIHGHIHNSHYYPRVDPKDHWDIGYKDEVKNTFCGVITLAEAKIANENGRFYGTRYEGAMGVSYILENEKGGA